MKNKIKELRTEHRVSQSTLATAVGVTRRTIYAIEKEQKDIHVSLAHKLAEYFGCGIDDLFDFSTHTTVDKALWFTNVVGYTAAELNKPVSDTTKLLEHTGLAANIIKGYDVWHTQGYEYMAEMLADELNNLQGV